MQIAPSKHAYPYLVDDDDDSQAEEQDSRYGWFSRWVRLDDGAHRLSDRPVGVRTHAGSAIGVKQAVCRAGGQPPRLHSPRHPGHLPGLLHPCDRPAHLLGAWMPARERV